MTNDNQHIPSGYKPSPLGLIPEDWEVKTIGECTNLLTNGFVGVATPHYTEDPDGITYIQGFNVTEGGFNLTGIKKVTRAFHKKNSKSSLREGDLLTIQTGDIGLTTIVTKELEGSNCHALIISRFKEMILPQFMLYYYNSSIGRNRFRVIETGTTMKHINTGDLVKFSIPVPSQPEQQRIVSVLSLWDAAIAKQTALIEQLTLRKRGLMQQLLTGKKRLKGFWGEWSYHKIQDHFSEIRDKNDGKGHIPMTISAKLGLVSQTHKFDRVVAGNSLDKYTLLRKDDFAYNKGNSNLYEMGCIYRLKEDSAVVPFVYICFRAIDNTCCEFYQQFFINHGLDKQLKQIITSGARGDGLLNVSSDDFMALKIPYPKIDEQKAIASILTDADKEIKIQKQKLAAMQAQKKGLMQVLLTGKRRIRK